MKRLCMFLAAGAVLSSFAAVTPIPVKTKAELIAALQTYKTTAYEIQVAKGTYEFSEADCMEIHENAGPSHLYAQNVRIVGMGETRDDVVFKSDGTMRILHANDPVVVEKVTFMSGFAKKNVDKETTEAKYKYDDRGGGVYGSATLTNCVVTECRADNFGGGVYNFTVCLDCEISFCNAGSGGGAYEPGVMRNCTIKNCAATSNGGGVYGKTSLALYDCLIENNTANGFGGGLIAASATNCIIRGNTAATAGGFGGWNKKPETCPELYNCQVYNNKAIPEEGKTTYVGGVAACRMIGGALYGNYVRGHGGGAAWYDNRPMYLIGVNVHDNYATGYGGGAHSAVFSNCTVSANFAGSTGSQGYSCQFYYCTLTKTDNDNCLSVGCTFTGCGGNQTLDNQIFRDLHEGTNLTRNITSVCRGNPVCTNCLFVGNMMDNYSSRLWFGVSGSANSPKIVNCTIVSNSYGGVVCYVMNESNPAKVENCVFYGNKYYDGTEVDICGWDSEKTLPNAFKFHNCAYGKSAHLFADDKLADYCDGPMYKYGVDGFPSEPGFNFGSAHEFEPKRKSPLRGLGVTGTGVTEYDIRGAADGGKYLRVRDGKIDLGCYQCWIPTPPLALFVR